MSHKLIDYKGVTWFHIDRVTDEDFRFLQTHFKFHLLDYDDIRSEIHLSKLDTYKHYLFFIFHIPTFHTTTGNVEKEELYVFLSDTQIVTVTHTSIQAINDLFVHLETHARYKQNLFSKGSAFLLYQILMDAFRQSRDIVISMAREVARLEAEISHRNAKEITVELGHARRNVLYVRHIVDPQRTIIASLLHVKRPFIPEDLFVYFDDLQDSLDTIWLTTDNLKLLLDGLFDVNEALLSHRTNEVITILTVISASLMAPTFIAGFYGMNVPWLPFAHNPIVVSVLYITTFVLILGLVLSIVRRSRP